MRDAITAMCWQTRAPMLTDDVATSLHAAVSAAGVSEVGDPDATRTVYATIVALVVLGAVLVSLAIWVLRRTRPEPELLAPLETMESRRWRKLDPAAQRRALDQSRPAGATPVRRAVSPPAVDSSFATVAPVVSFDDLSDDRPDAPVDCGADQEDPSDSEVAEITEAGDVAVQPALVADQAADDLDDETSLAGPEELDSTGELPDPDVLIDAVDLVDAKSGDAIRGHADDTPVERAIDPLLSPPSPPSDRSH